MFELDGSFAQDGESTVTRLEGRFSVPVKEGTTIADIQKRMGGEDGLLAQVEKQAEAALDGTGVKIWSQGVSMRKGEAIITFRVTIMDFDGFDGLRKALESTFKNL